MVVGDFCVLELRLIQVIRLLCQAEESGRTGAIISNHVSYVDILYHMSSSFPSFVAKVCLFTYCSVIFYFYFLNKYISAVKRPFYVS